MVNKEFIISGGSVIKDFEDRNIPQNSDKFVNVSVLIPVSEFAGKTLYSVELAVSKKLKGQVNSEVLPSLTCYSAKTLKINGVDYIKWQTQLTINYTNFEGYLYLSPYIIDMVKTIELDDDNNEVEKYEITKQSTFTTVQLNVIKAIQNTTDAFFDTQEGADAVSWLSGLINEKHIMTIDDFAENDLTTAINGCFESYVSSYYEGWLLIVKYDEGVVALFPYQDNGDDAFTMIKTDGSMSKLYGYTSSPQAFNELQLTYTKGEIDTILTSYYTKSETYSDDEVDALLGGKVDKTTTINGQPLSSNVLLNKNDVGLGNVENYGMVNSPSADATNKYVDAGGLYTYLVNNFADKTDYEATQSKVATMWAMFQDDGNSVVDTLYDLLKVFENFPETETIAPILSGIENRLDTLESMGNVVINCGSATLDADDWASNSDSYASDYPYKYEYTNILLVGATNFSVIFGVNSDTSLLSATAILNNETGVITFYAKEEPSDNIAIENIVAFTSMNAINTLTTQTINQVQQNKNDISDINSKLPTYAKKEIVRDGYRTYILNNNYEDGGSQFVDTSLQAIHVEDANNFTNCSVSATLNSVNLTTIKVEAGVTETHSLQLDNDGNLTLDGNAVGGGGGVPTIELDVSQFIGQGTFTFTDSQYAEIMDAMCFNLVLPNNGGNMFFIGRNNSQQASAYFYNISDNDSTSPNEIDFFNIVVNKSTKVGTIGQNAYPKGGGGSTLYQHNIKLEVSNSSYTTFVCRFQIITNSNTQFDKTTLLNYLNDNNIKTTGWQINASGWVESRGSIYAFSSYQTNNIEFNCINGTTLQSYQPSDFSASYISLVDNVIAL